jgi:hypothetical protein
MLCLDANWYKASMNFSFGDVIGMLIAAASPLLRDDRSPAWGRCRGISAYCDWLELRIVAAASEFPSRSGRSEYPDRSASRFGADRRSVRCDKCVKPFQLPLYPASHLCSRCPVNARTAHDIVKCSISAVLIDRDWLVLHPCVFHDTCHGSGVGSARRCVDRYA